MNAKDFALLPISQCSSLAEKPSLLTASEELRARVTAQKLSVKISTM